ncbi:hypothetical protein [Microvirga sp. 17 mud 1-3]|uniref:hypothetical protein n=1 Tax=Microvirga sp. 17 mud 1-3 TaxID=2082949 RepID=UPI0013A5742C|nr:hypothetical protein [Microvirga sp. 17 mud 1-3]
MTEHASNDRVHPALRVDDDLHSATAKCRIILTHFRIPASSQSDDVLNAEPFVRGRNRRTWQDIVFRDAITRYGKTRSYAKALNEAIEAYQSTQSTRKPEDRIVAVPESLHRMFRRWRSKMLSGADLSSKFDSNDFNEAILAGDAKLAAKIFVSLSDQTKRKIADRFAKYLR